MEVTTGIRNAGQRGQALAEFALISILLALLLTGAIDFGLLYGHKIELAGAARSGARWAASHPSAWTSAATPASTTVEGQVASAGGTLALTNNDSTIAIEYFAVNGSVLTACGRWNQQSNAFLAQNGYLQSACVTPGNLVRVTLTNSYPVLFGLTGATTGPTTTVQVAAAMLMTG